MLLGATTGGAGLVVCGRDVARARQHCGGWVGGWVGGRGVSVCGCVRLWLGWEESTASH